MNRRRENFEPAPPHPLAGWFFDRWLASEFGQYAVQKRADLAPILDENSQTNDQTP